MFWQIYLAPKLFGKRIRETNEFEKITNSVDELRKSMTEVVANIVELQRQLTVSHEQMVSVIKTNALQKVGFNFTKGITSKNFNAWYLFKKLCSQ